MDIILLSGGDFMYGILFLCIITFVISASTYSRLKDMQKAMRIFINLLVEKEQENKKLKKELEIEKNSYKQRIRAYLNR